MKAKKNSQKYSMEWRSCRTCTGALTFEHDLEESESQEVTGTMMKQLSVMRKFSFFFCPLLMMMRQMVKTAVRYAWVLNLSTVPLRGNDIFFSPRFCFPLNTAPQLASLSVSLCPQNIYLKKWSKKKKQNKTQMKKMMRRNPRAKR